MREQLEKTTAMARQNILQNQARQKEWYDQTARTRSFEVGEEVLLLLPTSENKLLAKWLGPYRVQRKVGPVTYEVHIPSRIKPLQSLHLVTKTKIKTETKLYGVENCSQNKTKLKLPKL